MDINKREQQRIYFIHSLIHRFELLFSPKLPCSNYMINSPILPARGTKQPGYLLAIHVTFPDSRFRDYDGRRGEKTIGARGQRGLVQNSVFWT